MSDFDVVVQTTEVAITIDDPPDTPVQIPLHSVEAVEISVPGPQGPQGDPGPGLPAGGTPGQLIRKVSTTDYDTEFFAPDYAPTGDARFPTTEQKAGLAGTSGTPGDANRYVTDADARNTNARTPTSHASTHQPGGTDAMAVDAASGTGSLRTLGTGAQQAVAGNDARLSNARTPTAHKATHATGGSDALAAADIGASPAISPHINLMNDSGRFAGEINPLARDIAAAFANSLFFSPFNSTTVASAGKFIHNNTTNGGTAGALTQDVIDLLAAMGRTGGAARFGVEFYIASFTMGAGTTIGFTFLDGVTRYQMTVNGSRAIFGFGNYTTAVFWVRLKTEGTIGNKLGIQKATADHTIYKNDVAQSTHLTLGTADGWTHINSQIISNLGYDNSFPYLYALAGDVVQIAVPAFFAGVARPGIHRAPVATINELSA